MSTKENNPFYFEALKCRECESTENLYQHRYNETTLCVHCVNKLLAEESNKQEKEQYYYEESQDDLYRWRNA